MAEKIRKWYNQGLWSAIMVKNATKKGVITQLEGEQLLGQAKEDN